MIHDQDHPFVAVLVEVVVVVVAVEEQVVEVVVVVDIVEIDAHHRVTRLLLQLPEHEVEEQEAEDVVVRRLHNDLKDEIHHHAVDSKEVEVEARVDHLLGHLRVVVVEV